VRPNENKKLFPLRKSVLQASSKEVFEFDRETGARDKGWGKLGTREAIIEWPRAWWLFTLLLCAAAARRFELDVESKFDDEVDKACGTGKMVDDQKSRTSSGAAGSFTNSDKISFI